MGFVYDLHFQIYTVIVNKRKWTQVETPNDHKI